MPKIGKGFVHKSNLLVKLFWEVPKQFIEDLFSREPDFFTYQGLVIFEGRQGNGKTIGMTQFINTMQAEFPKSKTITNYNYTKQDKNLKDWRDLIDYKKEHIFTYNIYMAIGQIISYSLIYILYNYFYDVNILAISVSILMFFLIISAIYLKRTEKYLKNNE